MSVFRDEVNLSSAMRQPLPVVKAPLQARESTAQNNISSQEEFEKVDFSDYSKNSQKLELENFQNLQSDANLIQTADKGVSEIQESLNDVQKTFEEAVNSSESPDYEELNKKIEENTAAMKKAAENNSFNGSKPLETAEENKISLKIENKDGVIIKEDINIPDNKDAPVESREAAEKFLQDVKNSSEQAAQARKKLQESQEGLSAKVDSLIEFDPNIKTPDISQGISKLVKEGITANTEAAKKAQLNILDEKIVLALISTTRAYT